MLSIDEHRLRLDRADEIYQRYRLIAKVFNTQPGSNFLLRNVANRTRSAGVIPVMQQSIVSGFKQNKLLAPSDTELLQTQELRSPNASRCINWLS